MHSLNEDYLNNQSVPLVMLSGSLRKIGIYQGKQELLLHKRPELLKTLREIAIIQSTESSNRIEGIIVPHERIEKILHNKQPPKNRPEGQVLGYRDVLAKIHTHFNDFEINPETILKMHKDMFKYTDLEGGHWKVKDNLIEERLPNGQWITRFTPVSAAETPFHMRALCDQFNQLWRSNTTDLLILVFAFIFDFLCIHPFSDGNGRMSRLLTVLLLHKINFDVTRYISYERLIEDTKERYYDILRDASQGWHQGRHRLSSWLEYNIGILIAAFKELEERVDVLDNKKGSKTAWVQEAIAHLPDEFSISDLTQLCHGISRPMIRHILETLRSEGKIHSFGLGRSAKWRKVK